MISAQLAWRTWLSIGGFGILLALEQWKPFKPAVDPRLKRYARNLFITISNAFALEICLGGFIVTYIAWLKGRGWGLLNTLHAGPALNIAATILILDLATYIFHRMYHEAPVMWRLHRVHHSDLDLDVTSASRFHLGEILLSTLYRILIVTLLGPTAVAATIFESALLAQSQLQHSNLKLPDALDRLLRWLFVTPDMHRVHHSDIRRHTNSNYSTVFSFWDRWFRTYIVEGVDQRKIKIGLPEYARTEDVTIGKLMAMPFGPACNPEHLSVTPRIG